MWRPSRCGGARSATIGPSTMNCAHSPTAITIATPAKTVVAVNVELVSVASRTASRPIANSARAAHPLDDPGGWNLGDDDEEGVDEDDDADLARPDRRVGLRKRREDVGKERAAGHHEHDVGGDQDEEQPIVSNCPEACSPVARRRSIRRAGIRDPREHNQREDSEGDAVEKVERLERAKVMGGSDDEARNRRAAAETEIACDSAQCDRGGALLR